ncbi:hypothetical protein ON010_g4564 [Phytophthora cinnamomi]|nr:hypothetical protein ON010_g4564 [Phytophthora cinnamomi]
MIITLFGANAEDVSHSPNSQTSTGRRLRQRTQQNSGDGGADGPADRGHRGDGRDAGAAGHGGARAVAQQDGRGGRVAAGHDQRLRLRAARGGGAIPQGQGGAPGEHGQVLRAAVPPRRGRHPAHPQDPVGELGHPAPQEERHPQGRLLPQLQAGRGDDQRRDQRRAPGSRGAQARYVALPSPAGQSVGDSAREGWPDKIFPQAVQFMNQIAEQQMAAQRKAAEAQMRAMQAAREKAIAQAEAAQAAVKSIEAQVAAKESEEETLRKRK